MHSQTEPEGYALDLWPTRAKAAYQDFFSLWKVADTDIPIIKRAESG
jgi:hypothetical protein